MKLSEFLTLAKAKIEDENNWTTGAYARDKEGRAVPSFSEAACKFCSFGAVRSMDKLENVKQLSNDAKVILDGVANELLADSPTWAGTIDFNDSHTHKEVMNFWDKAIQKATEKEQNDQSV